LADREVSVWARLAAATLRIRWAAVAVLAPRRSVTANGVRLTLRTENWITHYRWSTYAIKEPDTLRWLDRVVRDGDVVFDVGANIGVYSLYAALRHPRAAVIAFEPEYANLHLLRDNVVANGLLDRVSIYALALGDRVGLTHLHVQDLTPGSALHTESAVPIQSTRTGHRVVMREGIAVMTLDEFCALCSLVPNAIKIDVDGTEAEILRGAERTLRDPAVRTVLIELPASSDAASECRDRLRDAGLHPISMDVGGGVNEVWAR
jgi:FkbM family methyltransferase